MFDLLFAMQILRSYSTVQTFNSIILYLVNFALQLVAVHVSLSDFLPLGPQRPEKTKGRHLCLCHGLRHGL